MSSKYISVRVKKEVNKLAKGVCEYCKCFQKFTPEQHEYEHIIPPVQVGNNELDNIAKACRGCNNIKSISIAGFDPETQQIVPLFNPRKDSWKEHFQWSKDTLKIEGLTACGRATVNRLKLNRQELINIREITIAYGHPPK